MGNRIKALGIGAILLAAGFPAAVAAQEATESAVLNSGVAQPEASGARALSGSINRSLRGAGNLLNPQTRTAGGAEVRRGARPSVHVSYAIPANIDPLAGTDAPTYRIIGSGAVLRVSRSLRPSPDAVCVAHCS